MRTNKSIEDDRKFSLDAAIVRIMKARKEMAYEHLKAATIDAVKGHFIPQVDSIKRRIDALVESEYLERCEDDRSRYKYIAWLFWLFIIKRNEISESEFRILDGYYYYVQKMLEGYQHMML